MQLKQLEVFVQVARLGSFSRAAEALYLTQPTVSAHIGALESALDAKLVIRSTKEARLTPAGQLLFGYATQILSLCQRAERDVRASLSDVRGSLDLAASTVPAQYLLPGLLPRLRARWPKVFFRVSQGDSAQVARMIADGTAEVGLTGAPVQAAGCECIPFLTERLVIITPSAPRYRGLDGPGLRELLRTAPYLVREPGSGTRRRSEEFLKGIGLDPKALELCAQFESTEGIVQGVRRGLGVSIVSGLAAGDALRAGDILAYDYDSPLLEREFYLIHARDRMLSPAARMLLRELPLFYGDGEDGGEP